MLKAVLGVIAAVIGVWLLLVFADDEGWWPFDDDDDNGVAVSSSGSTGSNASTSGQSASTSGSTGTSSGSATSTTSGSTGTSSQSSSTGTANQTVSTGTLPNLPKALTSNGWNIKMNSEIDKDPVVRDWLSRLRDPDPARWRTYPNIPNPDVPEFDVKAGAEYGVANVPFCQQDMRCDLVVPGWHYRLITGDYEFLGHKCGGEGKGCLLLLINVMDKTYTWRNQIVDNGFTVPGRYWDGDKLEWAVWGLVSHASANMLNMPTMASESKVLNAGDPGNAGANCGDVRGCQSVDAFIVVHAGDRILATAEKTVVTK